MGCLQSSSVDNTKKSLYEEQLYYDPNNNLISFDPSYKHIPSKEVDFVSSHDKVIMKAGDECYIVSVVWLNSWLEFIKGKASHPKSIDNKSLIDPVNPRKLNKNVVAKKDYRPVCKAVWEFYFISYGGGPVLLFHVPTGLEDKSYQSGEWLKFVRMHEIVSVVYPETSIDRISFFTVSNPMSASDIIAKDNSEIAASHMMQDLGKNKIKQAQALQADINAGNAEAIGALMAKDLAKQKMAAANELTKDINAANADLIAGAMAKDLGDMKIREAKQKEEEANKAAAEAIANQLAADMAKKQMEEARKKEEEANKAAAEALALQLAADMAKKQMEEARKLEEEANKAAAEAIANQLAADMAKKQMEEARKKEEEANKAAAEAIANQLAADMAQKQMEEARKLEEQANKAAAEAIANQFAADMAKKQMEEARELERKEREEQERRLMESFKSMGAKMRFRAAIAAGKDDVAEEAAATMLQGAWRSKVARRKMEQQRELKIKLREEACARKLQSAYRARLARKRATAIRIEKQRLMEEACARKLQCKYRSRLARKKVIALREEKQRLLEEACARRLQCKYRSRLARKKVIALRIEKQRLMEEACARRLQCKYRARLARKKVLALRAEKQRLMEEACARRLQCKYRSRLARKKVIALREERQRLLEEGCAIKLQGAWRIRKSRKKVEALKAERQRLREEACAIKLQACWRIRKARERVAKLKAEKQRLLEEGAALMLQGAWRIRRARQRVNGLKREKGGAIKLQRLWKTLLLRRKFLKYKKSSVKVEKLIRGYLARKRMAKLVREFHPHNIIVTLQHAKDLNIADVNTSDPYVIVSAHRLQSNPSGNAKSTGTNGELLSYTKSKVIANTLNPTWNEETIVTSAIWNAQVALTVMDSDMVGAHDFLGQTTFLLPMIQTIYSGAIINCRDTPLNSYEFNVSDGNGKPIIAPGTTTLAGKGTISFTIRTPSLAYNMCGHVYKNSSGLMSKGVLKKRWMVLVDFKLRYYESQYSLDDIKGEIICADITSLVEEDSKKDGKTIKINYGKSKDYWVIKWDPDSPKYIQQMWYRKLIRCCPNVPDRELLSLNPRAVRACTTPSRPPAPLSSAKGQLKW